MAETAEDYFAGKVDLVAKENDNPINPNELDDIKNRISNGVSLMNFFGHFTSSSGFDINLDLLQHGIIKVNILCLLQFLL